MTAICATSFHACTASTLAIYMLFLGPMYDLETSCRLATRQIDRQMEKTERSVDRQMERELKGKKTLYLVTESPGWLGHSQVTANTHLIDPGAGSCCRQQGWGQMLDSSSGLGLKSAKKCPFSLISLMENVVRSTKRSPLFYKSLHTFSKAVLQRKSTSLRAF